MRGNVCLDTNIAIDLLNGNAKALKAIDRYQEISIPIIVIGELRFGAYRSSKVSDNLVKIDSLEMRCPVIEIDAEVADHYGSIRNSLFRNGTPIPENDIWIAACCLAVDSPIMTNDEHFRNIPSLTIVKP